MYKHGVYTSEVPTSLVPPANTSAGLTVVVGTAPVHLAKAPVAPNTATLCYNLNEATEQFGYSDDWEKYTLCEAMSSHFKEHSVAPLVLINVLDIKEHIATVENEELHFDAKQRATLLEAGVLKDSIALTAESVKFEALRDYVAAFTNDGKLIITVIEESDLAAAIAKKTQVVAKYDKLTPEVITKKDIIGGIDVESGQPFGLECVDTVFPRTRLIPGQIIAPGYSTDVEVAAVMTAKTSNLNGHFAAMTLTDIDTAIIKKYTEAPAWKEKNNYVDPRQIVCWPKIALGSKQYHLSTQLASLICKVDSTNDDIPTENPSNKNLKMNAAVLKDGSEVLLGPTQANYLNGQGIVTTLNFIGGQKAWGERTGAYPANTDPKDTFINIRRMFNWITNQLVMTWWQKIDANTSRRMIESVIDSNNVWLNGLASRGYILGGRVAFLRDENPTTDLLDGINRFHVYLAPPPPMRAMDFILEYDPKYMETLFG